MRIAAVGDVHLGADSRGTLRPELDTLADRADILLLAGDLTRVGTLDEAAAVADEFADIGVPVVAVLGNHDHHSDHADDIAKCLTDHGITVLEGTATTIVLGEATLGVAGVKGWGGGFAGRCTSVFGERLMREFAGHSVEVADSLRRAIESLDTDVTVALMHYAPVPETLAGEPPEIYPFLGSYLLGEVIDDCAVDLALHGHAHAGTERATTSRGVHVRNVAQPVIGSAYAIYEVHQRRRPWQTNRTPNSDNSTSTDSTVKPAP